MNKIFLLFITIILFSINCIACDELWIRNDTECNGTSYTIQYYDLNNCGTIETLPILNGTIIDCSCMEYWTKNVNPCINGVRLVEYTDLNNCNTTSIIPSDNNTYEECTVTLEKTLNEDTYMLIILFALMIVSTICAVMVHEAFFGLNALLTAFGITIMIMYNYNTIIIVAAAIMLILFIGVWFILFKRK